MVQENMVEYRHQNQKGAVVRVQGKYITGMTKDVYDVIYRIFPDKEQADGVADTLEKVLTEWEAINNVEFNKNLDIIVLKVKEKLELEFATKSDLKAGLSELELRIMQMINSIKEELKQDISNLKEDISDLKVEMEKRFGETNTRITNIRSELKEDISGLKIEIGKLDQKIDGIGKMIKRIAGVGSAVLAGVIVALITKYFHLIW